jgi:ATP-dependent RNA helicase RhlE
MRGAEFTGNRHHRRLPCRRLPPARARLQAGCAQLPKKRPSFLKDDCLNPTSFADLRLSDPLLRALASESYTTPTPIQAQAIPHLLAGRDLLGCAQTGTGKTAAFALPILQHLDTHRRPAEPKSPRVLVLSPTRELASQISESFASYGRNVRFRQAVIFGGVGQHQQVRALSRGVHIVVATPGRLIDLMQQGHVRLDRLEVFVLDEADRMLDMGFLPDLKSIIARLPKQRQSLFFTATLPKNISELAEGLLSEPVRVEVTPQSSTVELIEQRVMFVRKADKAALLGNVLRKPEARRVLVFARTKRGANDLAERLRKDGVQADAIHGNKSQSARERALLGFRTGRLRVLVATDIAARGIDVDGVTHVVNYELPHEPESYVHRIGRTGRAGAEGIALSFCEPAERGSLRDIERLIKRPLEVDADHEFHFDTPQRGGDRPPQGRFAGQGKRPNFRHGGAKQPAGGPPRRGRGRPRHESAGASRG